MAAGRAAGLAHAQLLALAPPERREQIVFAGFVAREQLPATYQAARVYVSASQYETFAYTLLEAMACGLPIIATRTGAISELVSHDHTGLLVPVGDERALGDALLTLLGNPLDMACPASWRTRHC